MALQRNWGRATEIRLENHVDSCSGTEEKPSLIFQFWGGLRAPLFGGDWFFGLHGQIYFFSRFRNKLCKRSDVTTTCCDASTLQASLITCRLLTAQHLPINLTWRRNYEGNSISKLQIQVATYVFELSAGNSHRNIAALFCFIVTHNNRYAHDCTDVAAVTRLRRSWTQVPR
jgi:hypothetical protein